MYSIYNREHKVSSLLGPLVLISSFGHNQVVDMDSKLLCSNLSSYPIANIISGGGAVINGHPLICGGHHTDPSKGFVTESSCYKHNKVSNTWTLHAEMNIGRTIFATAVVNGALMVIGGYSHVDGSTIDLDSIEYINSNGSVYSGQTLPNVRYVEKAVTLNDGRVILIGGSKIGETSG